MNWKIINITGQFRLLLYWCLASVFGSVMVNVLHGPGGDVSKDKLIGFMAGIED